MGWANEELIRQHEQGWSRVDKHVCAGCLSDAALAAAVEAAAEAQPCDYCDRSSDATPVAAPVDVILEAVVQGLRTEYGDPDNEGVAYSTADGGYQMLTIDTWDLLQDYEVTENGDLHADLSSAIDRRWCQRSPYQPSPHEALAWGWRGFREHVMHRARYAFFLPTPDTEQQREWGQVPPVDVPDALVSAVAAGGLTRVLPAGRRWVRARVHSAREDPRAPGELGSPPPQYAQTNRMTAAGISAFYGADTQAGALAEVAGYAQRGQHATVAEWETARPMPVIDLVDLPPVPSLFDPDLRHLRPALRFLHGFAADVARPTRPDDEQHLDYVPTQVIAEYLRWAFPRPDAGELGVMGVLWRSSKDPDIACCVLFVPADECVESRPGWQEDPASWLALVPGTTRRTELELQARYLPDPRD